MRATWIVAWMCVCFVGCGAAQEQTAAAEPAAPSAPGGEVAARAAAAAPAPEPAQAEPAPAPEPVSGPASITVSATVNKLALAAQVRLIGADGSRVEGTTGTKLTAPSGDYTLEVEATDAKALLDKPTETRDVTLEPGGDTTETVDFQWSKVKLNVMVNGALDTKATVKVMRKGAVVAEIKSGADYVTISPGRYGALVKTHAVEVEIEEIMFPQGGTRAISVPVQVP